MSDKCFLYFNYGDSCLLRLLTSVYTLRRNFNGNICIQLENSDENNDYISNLLKPLNVDIQYWDINKICKRNFKSVMAPKALMHSNYKTSIQIDADTSFLADPSELLDQCAKEGILVTHFNGWVSNGPIMRNRIKSFSDVLSKEEINNALDNHPAINCGVVGYTKGMADDFIKEWDDLTNKTAGRFIAEEIACQCVYFKYNHFLAPPEWNTSVKYGDLNTAKIMHYHGQKHTNLTRKNSRFWWFEVSNMIESGIVDYEDVEYFAQYDKNAKKTLEELDELYEEGILDFAFDHRREFENVLS